MPVVDSHPSSVERGQRDKAQRVLVDRSTEDAGKVQGVGRAAERTKETTFGAGPRYRHPCFWAAFQLVGSGQ